MPKRLIIFLVIFFSVALVFTYIAIRYINKDSANNKTQVETNKDKEQDPVNKTNFIKFYDKPSVNQPTKNDDSTVVEDKNKDKNILDFYDKLNSNTQNNNENTISDDDIKKYNKLAEDKQDFFKEYGNPYKDAKTQEELQKQESETQKESTTPEPIIIYEPYPVEVEKIVTQEKIVAKRYVYTPKLSTVFATERLRGILEEIADSDTLSYPVDAINQLETTYLSKMAQPQLTDNDKKLIQDSVHWLLEQKSNELLEKDNNFVWSTYKYDDNIDFTFDILSKNQLKTKVRWVVKVADPIVALSWFDDNTKSWKQVDTSRSKYAIIVNEVPNDVYGILCIRQSVDGYNWSPVSIKYIDVEKESANSYYETVNRFTK